MTSGFPTVSPVRKKMRSVGPSTPAHIFDGVVWNTRVSELKSNERGEVAVRLCAIPSNDHRTAAGRVLHFTSHLFANLERGDADVRTDRDDELGGVVAKGIDGARHDSGNRATPASVRCAHVPARWMREQNRDAVGGPRRNPDAFVARHECIAFFIGDRFGEVGGRDDSHPGPVHLPLLEQTIETEPEAGGEAGPVLANGGLVVSQVEAQIQRIEGRRADAANPGRERMHETVASQQRGAQHGHPRGLA